MPTDRETETLNYVVKYIRDNKIPPLQKEIAEHLNVSSVRAKQLLISLQKRGHLKLRKSEHRGITVIKTL